MSSNVEIAVTANIKDDDGKVVDTRKASFTAVNPDTIDEAISMWGGDVCLDKLLGQVTVERQAIARSRMTRTGDEYVTDDAIQQLLNDYQPRIAGPKKTKADKVRDFFAEMTPEERKALLRDLRAAEKDAA